MSPSFLARRDDGLPLFAVFDILQGLALFALVISILPPLFSRSVSRMRSWHTLLISCIAYCGSYLLLLGHQSRNGPTPAFSLCMYQSGLIYAGPPTVAAAAMVFVLELYFRLNSALEHKALNERWIKFFPFVPVAAHLAIFWVAVTVGLDDLEHVLRHDTGVYCHIDNSVPTTITGVTVVLFLAIMLLIEVYTIYRVWKRRGLRGFNVFSSVNSDLFPLSMFLRTATYTISGGLGIVLTDVFMNTDNNPNILLLLPLIPFSVALVFGPHLDTFRFYFFCTRKSMAFEKFP
ncbi:hypothetical protein C8J56DRAFT_949772 [Mycena floridula]|nr:hypothetical protein C8J56DRAFT_949772 [Mycena floridula]